MKLHAVLMVACLMSVGSGCKSPERNSTSELDAASTSVDVTPEKFLSGLKGGINIEREAAYEIGDFASGVASYNYLKTLGVTHVRLFYPFRPSVKMAGNSAVGVPPTLAEFKRILPAIHNANKVGLKVFFDLTDVMNSKDFAPSYSKILNDYFNMAAKAVADEKFDPALVAVGAVNEWGSEYQETNASYAAKREELLALLRRYLPKHVLITGGANWKHPDTLTDPSFKVSTDKRVIYDVHSYEWDGADTKMWKWRTEKLQKWAAEKKVSVLWGEAGYPTADKRNTEHSCTVLKAMPNALPLRPLVWAIMKGEDWRMNILKKDAKNIIIDKANMKLYPCFEQGLKALNGVK